MAGTLKAKSNPSRGKFHVAVRHFIIRKIDDTLNDTGHAAPDSRRPPAQQYATRSKMPALYGQNVMSSPHKSNNPNSFHEHARHRSDARLVGKGCVSTCKSRR